MKMSHNLKTVISALFCIVCFAYHSIAKDPQREKLEQFTDAISFRADFRLREHMSDRLESFEGDITPYVRATITNELSTYRIRSIVAIGAMRDKNLLPLIVDRFLNDEDKSVRRAALKNINWFLEQSSPEDLFDQDTVDTLGKLAMERLSQTPEQNWYSYLKLIKYLEYSKARDFLVDLWHEKQGYNLGYILEALYAVDQGKADELLLSDNARAKFGRDVGWYSALTRSAKQNEKSLELVKNILQTVLQVERNTERKYRIPFGMAIQLALETKDEECRQWVLDIFRNSENISKKRSAILRLLEFPKSILQNEEEQNTVINAVTNDKPYYDSLMEKDYEEMENGTLGRWILSPDSPLHKDTRERD